MLYRGWVKKLAVDFSEHVNKTEKIAETLLYSTKFTVTVHWLHYSPPVTARVAAVAPPKSHNLIHHRRQRKPTTRYAVLLRLVVRTSSYGARPVLVSRLAVATFSPLDAGRKVTIQAHLSRSARAAREIRRRRGDVSFLVLCRCRRAVALQKSRVCRRGHGCRLETGRWVPRMLSSRSLTAHSRLCSLLSLGI